MGYKASQFEPWWDSLYDTMANKISVKGSSSTTKSQSKGPRKATSKDPNKVKKSSRTSKGKDKDKKTTLMAEK